MSKFEDIEKIGRVKLTLSDETIVTGVSWGIIDAEDSNGEDLGYEILIFASKEFKNPLSLKDEDILRVEKL